ncbi:MAG TPA: TraR/DksA C4-type zinc finger protein [Acidimicrobiales bacterium]|jgi:RNA polymerase-binding transcription factor DksA|nr:TraR/DksA C4-type zinc finger protein [Acidimicrobiales bacterium]
MTTPGRDPEEESFESAAERDLDEVEASLAAIERALEGFDDGSYGKCEICGKPIEPERLAAHASTRRCAAHAVS